MIRSLSWKEWHEQRWQLAFGCIILMSFAAIGLRRAFVPDETIAFAVIVIAAVVLPVLVSMSLVAPERADGSLDTLLALPLRPQMILAVKTVLGLATCAVPLVAAALVTCVIAGGRELSTGQILAMYSRGMGTVLSLFMWMMALGIELPTEARAGLIGLGTLVAWGLGAVGLAAADSAFAWALSPFGFMPVPENKQMPSILMTAAVQLVIGVGLWAWAAYRLTREQRRPS